VNTQLEDQARAEIESLHEFFVGWFSGALPRESFESNFLPRFSKEVVFIPPAGHQLSYTGLVDAIRGGYANNSDFRIAIRNVRLRHNLADHLVVTYEEWQRNALASTPPDNGRVATVIFEKGDPLRWLHIHETWVPPDQMTAGPYDF